MKEIVGEKGGAEFAQIGGATSKIRILDNTVQGGIRLLCDEPGPRHHGLKSRAHFAAHFVSMQELDRDEKDGGNQKG